MTWSRYDRYCKDQYVALEQPEKFPTMPVKTTIQMLKPPDTATSFEKFNFDIHNLQNPEEKRELLTEEMVELLTTPFELAESKDAIMDALERGTERHVQSEDDGKNV